MSRIMCALHRIQRHPQTMQVSPLNRYRPKIIPYSNKFVMVDMFVVMLVLLRRRRVEGGGGGGILLSFEKNDISVASCVEFLQYFVFAKQCIPC